MIEWFSWVVAIILFLSSIISPWLLTRENNKHQLSLKKIDIYEKAKREALSNFIKHATNLHLNDQVYVLDEFFLSVNNLYIYFNDVPSYIDALVLSRNEIKFFSNLNKIVRELSKQIAKE